MIVEMRRTRCGTLAALIVGCGGGGTTSPPDAAPTDLLLMETAPTHVTEAGAMVVEPPSLVPFDVKVYVELADGAVKAYPAFGRRGSTVGFRVPLGARSYGYQLGDGFSATLAYSSARTVDFGAVVAGRADRAEAMRVTPVVLGFDGLRA